MCVACANFALLDATAKYLSQSYDTPQIVWARFAGHFVLAVVMLAPRYRARPWRSNRPGLQILRAMFLLGATAANFAALRHLQLAETGSIFFVLPLVVGALSVPLLGERVGPRRWAAIVIGFLGVMVIMRPGLGLTHWAVFLSLISVLCVAVYQITTRKLAGIDGSLTTQVYTALVGFLVVTPFAPFYWTTPDLAGGVLMIAMGLLGGVGHYLLILAHRLAPAPILAPFFYPQIIWMTLLGYVLFGDLPDRWTVAGAGIVIASGLYLLYRERRRA